MMTEPTANILVVDDDLKTLTAMEALLSGPGRNIVKAASSAEALRWLLRQDFALILMDVRLPEMDGFETAALIRQNERFRYTPIIFLSAVDTLDSDVFRGVASGAVDYLFKPVVPQVLQAKVSVFVDLFRMNEQLKQQAVRQSEERFRLVVESLQDYAVYMLDSNGRVSMWNGGAERIKGYQEAEVMGWPWAKFYTAEEQAKGIPAQTLRSAAEEGHYEQEGWRVRKDGSSFWANVGLTALRDLNGKLTGFSVIIRDLTNRKKAEERFSLAAEASPNAMLMVGENGSIVFANRQTEKLFGYTQSELLGLPVERLVPLRFRAAHSDYRSLFFSIFTARSMGAGRDLYGLRKDGSEVPVEIGLNPIETDEGRFVLASVIDITERKRAEEELQRVNAELERRYAEQEVQLVAAMGERERLQEQLLQAQRLESIGTLAGGVAHDFNNLLNVIAGYAAAIQQNPNGQIAESVEVIQETVKRGASLVQQLLAMARKSAVTFEQVEINPLMKRLAPLLKDTFPKTIEVTLDLEPNLPPIMADPNQIMQATLNLCVNARDAMPGGGNLTISTVRVSGAALRRVFQEAWDEYYACITVRDTGTGMDETTKSRVFEPFFTTKQQGEGTGLGLAVTYGIVRSHRGFIGVESEPNQGSSFSLCLPVPKEKPELLDSKQELREREAERPPGTGQAILFAEDEIRQLRLMQNFLESAGYKVFGARDGLEAVEILRRHRDEIRVAVLDLGLPKLNGWEAFRKMKEISPSMKAIFATGFMAPQIESQLDSGTLNGVILKPYQLDEVLEKISAAFRDAAATSPPAAPDCAQAPVPVPAKIVAD